MSTVTKSEEQVKALGDEALIEQHRQVEVALNTLLPLVERLETRVKTWDAATLPERRAFLGELPELVTQGDRLARSIGIRSAFTAEEVQSYRDRWMKVRQSVSQLGS